MKITVEYDVLASDWCNLLNTFIDGGVGREWWREVEVRTRKMVQQGDGITADTGHWITAQYGNVHVYREPCSWCVILRMHPECIGDKATDGKTWGWKGIGDVVQRKYTLTSHDLAKVANLAPDLFAEWLGSGERNLTTRFDANMADSFMQLAAFGVEVYG